MIRLFVTDMDGCFLNDSHQLHPDTFKLIEKCIQNNVNFAVASGRSFASLKRTFSPILDKITLIANNGTIVSHLGEIIHMEKLKEEDTTHFINTGLQNHHLFTLLTTQEDAYMKTRDDFPEEFINGLHEHFPILHTVDNLHDIKDGVTKISYYDVDGAEENSYPLLSSNNDREVNILLSAKSWVDVIHAKASKGHAVSILQQHLGLSSDETVVFGDYLNDIEMIQGTKNSYTPETAHPHIKSLATHIIGPNDDWSVYTTIKNLLEKQIENDD